MLRRQLLVAVVARLTHLLRQDLEEAAAAHVTEPGLAVPARLVRVMMAETAHFLRELVAAALELLALILCRGRLVSVETALSRPSMGPQPTMAAVVRARTRVGNRRNLLVGLVAAGLAGVLPRTTQRREQTV